MDGRSSRARFVSALVAVFLAGSLVPAAVAGVRDTAPADGRDGYRFRRVEKCVMRKINRLRRRAGVAPLERDKQMGYVARRHAQAMAAAGAIWHDAALGREITRWSRLGQNVGHGATCRGLMRRFRRSPGHRANMLGRWRFHAAGTVRAGGRLYVQQLFEARRNPGNVYSYP